jgi:hypothetical protein
MTTKDLLKKLVDGLEHRQQPNPVDAMTEEEWDAKVREYYRTHPTGTPDLPDDCDVSEETRRENRICKYLDKNRSEFERR